MGWGGIPQIFSPASDWQSENLEFTSLLSAEEFRAARASTLNAHYTSTTIIAALYGGVERLGFAHGRILEPSCGIGHFIGMMPQAMSERSSITAIELDPLTARIVKALYPDADVRNQPFEEARLLNDYFDLAISNIPFGDYKPFDPKFSRFGFQIHDYFFAAALERVRPGGLVVFITSKGTMDKADSKLRDYVSERANLLGAIRLPNTAFKKNANTEVTSDILFLQKRLGDQKVDATTWKKTVPFTNSKGEIIEINEYFAQRPHMMLGEMRLEGRMYQRNEPTLAPDGRILSEDLALAIEQLPQHIYQPANRASETAETTSEIPAPGHVKPNAYTVVDDEIAIREGNTLKKLPHLAAQTKLRIRGMIQVRDAMRECLCSQMEDHPEDDVILARSRLNQTYDRFVSRYGAINERANALAFRGDPDLPLLLSLENYDSDTKRATKTAIFRERTIHPQKPVESVDSPKAALIVSLNERGKVDLPHMARLLRRPVSEFLPDLRGVLYLNPQNEVWETEDHYLSGNVREKLAVAEIAALSDARYRENVEALQPIQPEDLSPADIDARLGACWIPVKDIEAFARNLLAPGITITYTPQLGCWGVRADYDAKNSVANTTDWGTERATALELIEDALNLRTPTVYDTTRQGGKEIIVVNATATEAAREKQQKIKDEFKQWIWQDDERRERLCKKYNDEFNGIRLRHFNGEHLTLPGASNALTLYPHQKAAVWRILQTPNTLLGHVVGAGKTFTMVAAAMELKRLGLAQKPMFVVPNHMLGQFSSELLVLYPSANILAATKEDFEKNKRRELMSRIATGNWDTIIVTHSGFEKIPMSPESKREFFQTQIDELAEAILAQQGESHNSRIVKQLERAKKRLEERLKTLAADQKKDNTLTFEELGVDRLFVDEAHYFKNLFYVSKMTRVAGLPQTSSERAFDMYLKTQYIQRLNRGGGVVFATGTPIANSVAEMFTMQRYLQMEALHQKGLRHFDSWAGTFGEPVTAMELAPDGSGYRLHTRFARFINVPELMQIFCQTADIQTAQTLKLPVPKIHTGKPIIVRAPATPALKDAVARLVKRADAIRNRQIKPDEDNMLKITSEGRKAALDLRVLNPHAADHPDSKLNLAVEKIFEIWRDHSQEKATQLVFCDLSTPSKLHHQFSAYVDIKEKLIRRGVPVDQIAFMQDFDSDSQKESLFRDVRAGRVRVLLGSTQKMGAGTNVQERLIALHHMDAPWRPADVEQREGRILRQGNRNDAVHIYRYVTEGSFDAYMWQTLETKAKFIHQVMTGDTHLRRIEDIDTRALTYAEVKAIASGNPLVIEKASVDGEVTRLSRLEHQHAETQYRIRSSVRHLKESIPVIERRIAAIESDIAQRAETRSDAFEIKIDNVVYKDRAIAGELLIRAANRLKGQSREQPIGTFAGFQLFVRSNWMGHAETLIKGQFQYAGNIMDTAIGTMRSLEHTVQNLEENLERSRKELADCQKKSAEYESKVGEPFEYEGKLKSLAERQAELEKALDITKNQGPNSLATDTDEPQAGTVQQEVKTAAREANHIRIQ